MDADDDRVKMPPQPVALEAMSIADLETRIDWLKAEILRAQAMINQKQSVRHGADALFRSLKTPNDG